MPEQSAHQPDPETDRAESSRQARTIVLTGFMGSGKSTVGPILARRLGVPFVDVDTHIESAQQSTIAALFETHGEPWFRELEHQAVRDHLTHPQHVLALGGGAMEDPRTRELLFAVPSPAAAPVQVIYLEATLDTVLQRCAGTESVRPVFADQARLKDRYHRRLPLYQQAHITIPVDHRDPSTIVESILSQLGII